MATADHDKPGFESDIRPLFRDRDRAAMRGSFDLWSYADVVANGQAILERVADGSMPCDGPWPPERVDLFLRWLDDGAAQ
jgi:hypothetical protein